ncbi:hypothetical protein VPNG_05496 [Cytospora leucostoma]|uniref:Uncharacterized protein n=1 Tax=Cytospora leucostoma TaxID=1230097 RepID=A0A423XBR6_9PEZI|nr:hypothetical protein VPNG_05496 [Cytospora leucostoma]
MIASSKWKKALLPSLGSRRRDNRATNRFSTSKTDSEVINTSAKQIIGEQPSIVSGDDDLDDRVISELLGTTAGTNDEDALSGIPSQPRRVIRSHTIGVMSSTEGSSTSGSPYRVQKSSPGSSGITRKASRRNIQAVTCDFSRASPRRSPDGLVRPLPKSQSSHLLGGETSRIAQSPSISPGKPTERHLRHRSVRKGAGESKKISRSVTSVLLTSREPNGSATDSVNSAATSKVARFKKNKVFAKFAGVLSEHFSVKGTQKDEKTGGTAPVSSNRPMKQIINGLPLGRLTLAQLPLLDNKASGTVLQRGSIEDDDLEGQKENTSPGRADAGRYTTHNRLALVDEVDIQDDPFSGFSSGNRSTEFDARLKSVQTTSVTNPHPSTLPATDPFLAEQILDTSVNSILRTPPVACSTPRTRSRSLLPCKSPSKQENVYPDSATEVIMISPGGPPISNQRRRKVAIICESPTRFSTSPGNHQEGDGFGDSMGSPSRVRESSDSTRLSSYPPGSTIRHVPRSMGRLTDVPKLSVPTTMCRISSPIGRKKHPSPSKGQLDLYGRFIEDNIALGIFKDPDELAVDFDSPKGTTVPALSPSDKNRLMRGSAASNLDLRKNYNSQGLCPGSSMRSRSRIPQPVSQLSRSRTESAFVRDFLPVNHGDLSTDDELQWESSAYKIGRGRGSRCHHCGSMTEEDM